MVKHDDVIDLVRKIQEGETNLYTALFKECGQIRTYTVKKYLGILRKYNVDVEDFKQHLNLCFIECVNKYPKDHKNFVAYAFTYLNQSALQFLHDFNKLSDDEQPLSLDVFIQGLDKENITLLDTIVDETALESFTEIEDKITHEQSAENIRKILSKFISDDDINLLYDIYGFNGVKTIREISVEYHLSINDIIRWERMCILILQTNEKIYEYKEQLLSNVSSAYNYTYSRFKYTGMSSTESIAIKNLYIENKIEKLKELVEINLPTLHKNIANLANDNSLIRIPPKM